MISTQSVLEYFKALDDAIERLSKGREGALSNLPAYALKKRRIKLGVSADGSVAAIKFEPDPFLTNDDIQQVTLTSVADVNAVIARFRTEAKSMASLANSNFFLAGSVIEYSSSNPLVPPAHEDPSMIGCGSGQQASMAFRPEGAKLDAIAMWNYALLGKKSSGNFLHETKGIFNTFASIIRRRAFVERRIHRYLRDHAVLLLPAHVRFFFEHELRLGDEVRRVDVILQREPVNPAHADRVGVPGLPDIPAQR